MGFPCNQFDINSLGLRIKFWRIVTKEFNVKFPMFSKV